jgi:hypothetical protein
MGLRWQWEEGGVTGCILAESHEGAVDSERGFGRSILTRSSTFVLNFCRRPALASRWVFKLVTMMKWAFPRVCKHLGQRDCPEKEATALDRDNAQG